MHSILKLQAKFSAFYEAKEIQPNFCIRHPPIALRAPLLPSWNFQKKRWGKGGTDSRNSWIALSSVECILLASDILNVSSALFCDVSRQQGSPINMAHVFDAFFVVAKVGRQLFHTFCILIITSAMRKEDRVYTDVMK